MKSVLVVVIVIVIVIVIVVFFSIAVNATVGIVFWIFILLSVSG